MADPLSAFAAAGNVLQFLEIGVKFLGKSIDFYKSSQEQSAGMENLTSIGRNLYELNTELENFCNPPDPNALAAPLASSSLSTNNLTSTPAYIGLKRANSECLTLSIEFVQVLERLSIDTKGRALKSAKLAWTTIWNGGKLAQMENKIAHARGNLILSFMVFLNAQGQSTQTAFLRSIKTTESKVLDEMQKTTLAMQDHLQRLERDLSSLSLEEQGARAAMEAFHQAHKIDLDDLATRVSSIFKTRNQDLDGIGEKLDQVLSHLHFSDQAIAEKDKAVATQRLLASMSFPKANDRRSQISEAHGSTFEWILQPPKDSSHTWDGFSHWLGKQNGNNIYWIRGKPGSGKSTLMRFLEKRLARETSFGEWSSEDVLKASHYFWYGGSPIQRSVYGLLRSLISQLCLQRQDLVQSAVSNARWNSALFGTVIEEWSTEELRETLLNFTRMIGPSQKILLLIDGLDECDGSDESRLHTIEFLESLTLGDRVKLCLTSRPWVVYQDAFEDCPTLRLEELTSHDIRGYVDEALLTDRRFRRLQNTKPDLVKEISDEILQKAEGVFLWVHLVVRDLLKIARDGGLASQLMKKLRSIPPDLDLYFLRMMESIDVFYQTEASAFMQISLYDLKTGDDFKADFLRAHRNAIDVEPCFRLLHLHYIDEDAQPNFALQPEYKCIEFGSRSELNDILDAAERRLTSRCMGLLEVVRNDSRGSIPWLPKVQFLHRTVQEFLLTPSAQNLLHSFTQGPYDALLFYCNIMLADIESFDSLSLRGDAIKVQHILTLLEQIHKNNHRECFYAILDKFGDLQGTIKAHWTHSTPQNTQVIQRVFFDAIRSWKSQQSSSLSLAMQLGWKGFVSDRLTKTAVASKKGRPLLDYALRRSSDVNSLLLPDFEVVSWIIDAGGDFDEPYCGTSIRQLYLRHLGASWDMLAVGQICIRMLDNRSLLSRSGDDLTQYAANAFNREHGQGHVSGLVFTKFRRECIELGIDRVLQRLNIWDALLALEIANRLAMGQ